MKKILYIFIFTACTIFVGCRENKSTADKVEDAIEEVSDEVEDAIEEVSDEVEDAVDDVGDVIKDAVDD